MHLSCDQFTFHAPGLPQELDVEVRFLGGIHDGLSKFFAPHQDHTYRLFRYKGAFYKLSGMEIYCEEPHLVLCPANEDEIMDAWEFVEV